ncbi:MAG: outer membrane protein assembly factor BamA [Spirochaetes bacterium GWC1_27_15]|nr:MAG: outer membrane protein assembly factor BamA [Spirochaetes bacterium GWB1_27_13]OHD21766.1 MAG: outer membrane protein assembly factor BamA [Spirochaetes bacterium GWC1_27_15]
MKKRIILFVLVIVSCFMLFSEENVEGKIINKIILKGLKKAKKKDVLATMMTKEQMPLDMVLIEQDYQNLIALDSFDEIEISTNEAYDETTKMPLPGMIDLVFEFFEKSTVQKIIFEGNNNIAYGFLIGDVTIKRGDFLKKSAIINDINILKDKYRKKGFTYVDITYKINQTDELKAKNQVDLVFVINEGVETYVSEIIINGNDKYSDFTLKSKMKTKERKFLGLQKGIFVESDFYQDIEDIKKYYRDQGFYFVDILEPEITKFEIEEEGKKREITRIKIQIKEGKQYKFGGLIIEGNKIFSSDDLTYNLKLRKDNIFNYSKFQEDKFTIQKKYNDYGYVQTVIEEEPIVDNENSTISFKFKITESKRSYIEAVYFKGNTKTKNYVLYRAVSTEAGQIFDYSKLVSSVYGLMNLGFFTKAEPDVQQGSAPGLLKITYLLEEQSTAEIRFGLQITTNKWPPEVTLFGELTEKNFLGRELVVSGKVDLSLYKQGFTFSIDDPWFFNYPWSLGASAKFYHEWEQKVLKTLSGKDWEKYRADSNSSGTPSEDDLRTYFNDKYANNDESNPNYIGANGPGSWANMGIHYINFEMAARTGYRFLKYFSVSGDLSVTPIYAFLPTDANGKTFVNMNDIYYNSYRDMLKNNSGWSVKSRISTTFAINTTYQRINPYEGIRFSFTNSYTFGHYDSVGLSSKFTVYWKILDMYFNDWAFKQVLVFNTGASFIFPGFRNLGGVLNGSDTAGKGPILQSSDYLTVDGFFVGRGWGNSIGATSFEGRLTNKKGFARFDFSLEYRIPIHEKYIWVAAFVDMVNLVEGPTRKVPFVLDGNVGDSSGTVINKIDDSFSWMWWNQNRSQLDSDGNLLSKGNDWYNKDMTNWWGVENWYGSVGVGLQLTLPQLPLSFYVVKRFKINQYSGFEWVHNSPGTANLDFVLSIVGYYF